MCSLRTASDSKRDSILYEKKEEKRTSQNSSNKKNRKPNLPEPPVRKFNYPFEIDSQDHCETPQEAHEHISLFLTYLAQEILRKDKSQLSIYDPFYCEGRIISNFSNLGFTNVNHPCEDFYTVLQSGKLPDFDVIVTNPPYSGDHIERFLKFCVSTSKPWFLLLPNFVYMKDYYIPGLIPEGKIVPQRVFYVVPEKRYLFWTPKGRHQQKSKEYTSPFVTSWYCHFGEKLGEVLTWVKYQPKSLCDIVKEIVDLLICVLD